jgi:hypothetical protein
LPESLPKSLNDKGKHPTVEKAVDYGSNKKIKIKIILVVSFCKSAIWDSMEKLKVVNKKQYYHSQ